MSDSAGRVKLERIGRFNGGREPAENRPSAYRNWPRDGTRLIRVTEFLSISAEGL
jgi:hypothetical protein